MVYLFGSLLKNSRREESSPIELKLPTPLALIEVLNFLSIPAQEISLAMVNYKSVPKDWPVRPGDRLSLFPREYPIFADWMDHRLNV